MNNIVNNRSEILFLYDTSWSNPNGDPVDENKPRIDEGTGINLVTDVRLKRTIRDYLYNYKGKEVFIREVRDDKGNLAEKEDRMSQLNIKSRNDLINKCIDIRLFGATTAVEKKTIVYTGPVQFRVGQSLHPVEIKRIKGVTVMPSGQDKKQGTFTDIYVLPYSIIAFYGVVNENVASETRLSEKDVNLMLEAIWKGTKNLISRSKFGQMPRLLLQVIYKEDQNGFFIGEFDKKIKLTARDSIEPSEIRSTKDYTLEIGDLVDVLNKNKEKISEIRYKHDDQLQLTQNEQSVTFDKVDIEGINSTELNF